MHLSSLIETFNIANAFSSVKKIYVGDFLKITYLLYDNGKEKIQYYEGLVISLKNRGQSKTFTLRRTVLGIGLEHTFLLNSPRIVSFSIKQSSKMRKAKLYFLRSSN